MIILTQRTTLAEWPWAESSTTTSTFDLTRASTRSSTLAVIPTAAPHRRRPCSSFADSGYLICFSISLMVMSPFRLKSASTIGSFSTFALARMALASFMVTPSLAVTRFSDVMHSLIGRSKSSSNFKSRLVMIPTSFLPSVMGTPEMRNLAIRSLASLNVWSAERKNGSVMTPFSERFTRSTSSACSAIDIFLCITPIPPCLAMAIAMRCSVTVSMPALIIGMFSLIFLVRLVVRSTWLGITSE